MLQCNWTLCRVILFSVAVFFIVGCNENYTSKKRGYFRIDFPAKKYQLFNDAAVPYTFEYPVYGTVTQDSTYFDNNPENAYWRNIDFPRFNARIFLSYKLIGGQSLYKVPDGKGAYKDSVGLNRFDKLVNDAFTLTNKNEVVASGIHDSLFKTPNGLTGVYFKVGGNAATATQFFITDTVKHFIRGALYFQATPNADSIRPVQQFLAEDVDHLINSFRWKQ